MSLRPGQTLSHYHLLEKIGEGGMGVVYRARDERLERDVAIKVLPAGALADEAARKRFHKEALALSRLSHPNVGIIHDFFALEGMDLLVMEYILGQTLAQRLASGGLPEKEVASLGVQIASALDEAHGQRIVHRDLKPGNILVTPKGQVKVLDFGIARWMPRADDVSRTETMTYSGAVVGTLPYMAPEQLRGENVDARTDIFALGAVLYEMATGVRPFREETSPRLTDAILHQAPGPPRALNPGVSPEMERIILKCLEKKPVNRYQHAEEVSVDLKAVERAAEPGTAVRRRPKRLWPLGAAASAILVLLAVPGVLSLRRSEVLAVGDPVLLADFVNTTDDPIFDGTLREALAVKLEESSFFSIVPDRRVQETLRSMGRPPGEPVTDQVAREICQREGIKAMVEGAIAPLGRRYVITLHAAHCTTGLSLARLQVEASSPEEVLAGLGRAASRLRGKLGESLSSIQAHDTPIKEATTSSFDALKAFSLGLALRAKDDELGAIPFFKRAIDLDPEFAMAHATLGSAYMNLGEKVPALEQMWKAFELRDRVSDPERFYILSRYYDFTGQSDKSLENYVVWTHTYPRVAAAHNNLGELYKAFGQYDKALEEQKMALELDPNIAFFYVNVAESLIALDRLKEAKAVLREMAERNGDSGIRREWLYVVAFLEGDAAAMEEHAAAVRGTADDPDMLLRQCRVALSSGRLRTARELSQRAVDLMQRQKRKQAAAVAIAEEALFETEFGNPSRARDRAEMALSISSGIGEGSYGALALARAGRRARASGIAQELARQNPGNAWLQELFLPVIAAAVAIEGNNPKEAIRLLRTTSRRDMSMFGQMLPIYLRGLAQLRAGAGMEAAAEFQKIVDHRGVAPLSPIHALARLGLARAHALNADRVRSRAAYEDLFDRWEGAEPGLPILQAARAEYAHLK